MDVYGGHKFIRGEHWRDFSGNKGIYHEMFINTWEFLYPTVV